MYEQQERVYYYITLMNENYEHPAMPEGIEDAIIKGMYLFRENDKKHKITVQLLGSGTIFNEVIQAANILQEKYDIGCDLWSVTSFNELRREAMVVEHENRFSLGKPKRLAYVAECLQNRSGPVIAATDYIRLYADQIRPYLQHDYVVLGTDGYGRSDTRKQLRHFFEVDSKHIVYATLKTLVATGKLPETTLKNAIKDLGINLAKVDPVGI